VVEIQNSSASRNTVSTSAHGVGDAPGSLKRASISEIGSVAMPISSPLAPRPTALEVVAGHDLSGKTAIVTGGASGIGVETVRALATAGAEVTIAARSVDAARDVAASMPGNVSVGSLDLSDLASVRGFAQEWLGAHDRLDLLIENAGVMAIPELQRNADGWEMQLATNVLGHQLLAVLLAPVLAAAAPSRVVCLSSSAHRRSPFVPEDPQFETRAYDPWLAYGQSKTGDVLLALELTRRLRDRGVTANSVDPGGIMTNLQRHMDPELPKRLGWVDDEGNLHPAFKTPEQGAATTVWAAVGSELDGVGGLYLQDCAEAEPTDDPESMSGVRAYALDADAAVALWELCEATHGHTKF
jgi:NAD(P)-dependent dehydrogenase (short-subunit alcohol dehydrogenase family)